MSQHLEHCVQEQAKVVSELKELFQQTVDELIESRRLLQAAYRETLLAYQEIIRLKNKRIDVLEHIEADLRGWKPDPAKQMAGSDPTDGPGFVPISKREGSDGL